MGSCLSSPGGPEVSEIDKARHKDAEKLLREAKAKMAAQVKVLLLGSGDSGKSTVLKQMRLIHKIPFSPHEVESYRQLIFENLTRGLKYLLDSMEDMDLKVSEANFPYIELVENASDLRDAEPFPMTYYEPLKSLWEDPGVQKAWERGNEAALPENLLYFYSSLDELFDPAYTPSEQDIIQCRARTIGITETTFNLREHEMLMVDVGGQKSERRKWIHCFQDVTSILFLVSLSGYDQCLVEDKDANQMQDAMTIWDSICHSQWFKQTSIILFLNKNDLFERKIPNSDIKTFFPDFEGEPGDARAGRDYFKRRFAKLAQKAGRSKEREIYIHITTATDTAMLRVVMAAVEVRLSARIFEILCCDINLPTVHYFRAGRRVLQLYQSIPTSVQYFASSFFIVDFLLLCPLCYWTCSGYSWGCLCRTHRSSHIHHLHLLYPSCVIHDIHYFLPSLCLLLVQCIITTSA